ncbi:MAG: hypothetical protein RLZZ542_642, partial [Pseudomonadota bacterium]
PGAIAWGTPGGGAGIGLTKPFNGDAASVGNGVMVALEASSREQVHRLHDIALAHGGTCEGPPGPRGDSFYAAYFRDPDGNKLNAFLMTQGAAACSGVSIDFSVPANRVYRFSLRRRKV